MASEILTKLKIKPPHKLLSVRAPGSFAADLSLPPGCVVTIDEKDHFDSIHWFVTSQAEVDAGLAHILTLATPGMPIWGYFPKRSSGIQTDLTRDKGWDQLMTNPDLRYLNLISFNDTWSAFSFRLKTDKDRKEAAKPKVERAIFQYADSKTKTITLPDDVLEILNQHPAEKARFDALAFSHKREFIEWIIEAKRPETRQNRLKGLIERLVKG